MATSGPQTRSVRMLAAFGVLWLLISAGNLASFPSTTDPVAKWVQLTIGIGSIGLAAMWLRWAVKAARARKNHEISSRP